MTDSRCAFREWIRSCFVGHPEALRQIFTADPMALYAGRGNGFLEPILGPSSLLCADGQTLTPLAGGFRGTDGILEYYRRSR